MSCFKERINILWEEAKNKDYRITQKEFASKLGATRSQFQGWLIGAGEPDTEMLKTISQKSDVSVDWLVGITDIRHGSIDSTKQFSEEIKKNYGITSIDHEMDKNEEPGELTPEQIKVIKATVIDAINKLKKQG